MPVNHHSAEAFRGQSELIDVIKAAQAFYSAKHGHGRSRYIEAMDTSDAYLRGLTHDELLQIADAIWGKCLQVPSSKPEFDYFPRNRPSSMSHDGGFVPSGVTGTGPDTRWNRDFA